VYTWCCMWGRRHVLPLAADLLSITSPMCKPFHVWHHTPHLLYVSGSASQEAHFPLFASQCLQVYRRHKTPLLLPQEVPIKRHNPLPPCPPLQSTRTDQLALQVSLMALC
jgi:hypothetical protein